MQIRTVDVKEAQANFRELLSLVLEGTEIVLTEGDTPLARLVSIAPQPKTPRKAGLHKECNLDK